MKTLLTIAVGVISMASAYSQSFYAMNVSSLVTRFAPYLPLNNAVESANGGSVTLTNGLTFCSFSATNTDTFGAVRLIHQVNANANSGAGTLFGSFNHIMWVRAVFNARNGTLRATLGHSHIVTTNIAIALTNRGVGFEITGTGTPDEMKIRLIAHNGTNATNGPWVDLDDVFKNYTVGVEQRVNGTVNLYFSHGSSLPQIKTNATISGGPTANATAANSAFDIRSFSANTNSGNGGMSVFWAGVEVVP